MDIILMNGEIVKDVKKVSDKSDFENASRAFYQLNNPAHANRIGLINPYVSIEQPVFKEILYMDHMLKHDDRLNDLDYIAYHNFVFK